MMLAISLSVVTAAFLVALVLASLYVRYCRFGRLLAKIPGPQGWPLVGNGIEAMLLKPVTAFPFLRDINKKFRKINKLSSFLVAVINISSADYVEKLFATSRFHEKRMPYNFMQSWLCEGILISNGDKWKQRRKFLVPAFHFSIVRKFRHSFNEQTERFLSRVDLETEKPHTEVLPLINRTTLDIMCETALGTSINDASDAVTDKYLKALHMFGTIVVSRLTKVWLHVERIHKLTTTGKIETKLVKDMHDFTDDIIQERISLLKHNDTNSINDGGGVKRRLALLDLLLENEKIGNIDMAGVREEVDTLLFRGHDTIATALSFMMMRIANEQEIQDRIYEEMVRIFGVSDRTPTLEDVQEMKYLECCIKESLRLYPSVPLLARYVSEDVVLGEYKVPEGAYAFVHVFDIHRDPATYPEPERFVPERFLPEQAAARHPCAYMPFSAGARNCIGIKFAMLEMKTLMSGLFRRYRLEPVTRPADLVFITDMVLRCEHPLRVRFRKRIQAIN